MSYVTETLKCLAMRGAANQHIAVSTRELGKDLGVSQQTASNRLVAIEGMGLIKRRRGVHGQDIMITREGMSLLRKELADYQRIFSESGLITISGVVTSGLGEGQYYLNRDGYRSQLKEKLGFNPFGGTLNLKVTEAELAKLSMVSASQRLHIDSFKADGRTFGGAECISVKIRDVPCAIIIPKRSHHSEVLEIISETQLRKKLNIKDGDIVSVLIERHI